jgi:Ni/Co efflux regulator RcnB
MIAMPKSVLFLLLATAAVPAMAADDDDGGRTSRREAARAERAERAESSGERMRTPPVTRTERSIVPRSVEPRDDDRPAIREAVRERAMERRPPRVVEVESRDDDRPAIREAVRERVMERRPPRVVEVEPARPTFEQNREAVEPRVRERRGPRIVEVNSDSVREWRRAEREAARTPALVEQRTDTGWEPLRRRREQAVEAVTTGVRAPAISRVPREGTQPPLRAMAERSGRTAHHWRGDWRSDRRYDWRNHRRRHRSLFRFGFYYDPFGWSYRPYSIGWRLWPSYYRSSYWLHDAWTYRLPYAPPGYRWIRYYDDVLLVDTWDGRVVDVIRNFFW